MGCFVLITRIIYTPYKQLRHIEYYKIDLKSHKQRIITWSIIAIQKIFVGHLLCARYRATRDIAAIKTDKNPCSHGARGLPKGYVHRYTAHAFARVDLRDPLLWNWLLGLKRIVYTVGISPGLDHPL